MSVKKKMRKEAWREFSKKQKIIIISCAFLFLYIVGNAQSSEMPVEKPATGNITLAKVAEQKKKKQPEEFLFTVEEMIVRYNQAFRTLENKMRISVKKENKNKNLLTIQGFANNNIGVVITANVKTRAVQSLIFLGSGTGTNQSGLDILIGATATIMAIENPQMPVSQRGRIVKDLGLTNGKLVKNGETLKFERNDVQYSVSLSDMIGMMLTAEPVPSKSTKIDLN